MTQTLHLKSGDHVVVILPDGTEIDIDADYVTVNGNLLEVKALLPD